ncbi:hypothetical protein BURK_024165 [Burkholderia sp. SJ98]|nr:hypothetical protein BURK_024165 [Burkholderia sp. SJ98]
MGTEARVDASQFAKAYVEKNNAPMIASHPDRNIKEASRSLRAPATDKAALFIRTRRARQASP